MDEQRPDEVRVGFKCLNFFCGVVIEDSDLEVVGAADDPMLLGDELDCADGEGGGFKSADGGLHDGGRTLLA